MGPKFGVGDKVVIKADYYQGLVLDSRLRRYDSLIGEVVESVSAVAFAGDPREPRLVSDERITVYHYTVRIDDEVTLEDVFEEYLRLPSQ